MENVFLKKIEIELPWDSVISLLDTQPKEMKTGYLRDICILMFISALFTIAQVWEQPKGL